jgi:hypothetical protein
VKFNIFVTVIQLHLSRIEKLIEKLKQKPNDFTWSELQRVLRHFGYAEIKGKGSRRKFVNRSGAIISIH